MISRKLAGFASFIILVSLFFTLSSASGSAPTEKKAVIVTVEFKDVKHQVRREQVNRRFNWQLNNYIKEMSYGKVVIDFDITRRWYVMPEPIGRYRISSRNLEVDKDRVSKLILDALSVADGEVDFAQYDFVVILMRAFVKEYGMVGLCGHPGMLDWMTAHRLSAPSGERIKEGVAVFCHVAHLGTLFHDICHVLGGVKDGKRQTPCLYDHDLQAKPGDQRETAVASMINVGFWDPMSCHYFKREIDPPGITSWTKMRLGWIDSQQIQIVQPGQEAEIILGPLEEAGSQTLVIKIPVSKSKYYLIENRQPIGFDKNLPGNGVLIMYADDKVAECRHGKAPVKLINAHPDIPHLQGAALNIGGKDTFLDEKNRLKVKIVEKIGNSYKIRIGKTSSLD